MNGKSHWALLGAFMAAICSNCAADPLLRTIVLTGEDLPGAPGKVYQESLTWPTINNRGQISFQAFFDSPGYRQTGISGIWTNSRNANGEMIVTEEEQVPGAAPGVLFDTVYGPKLNDLGQIVFGGNIMTEAYPAGIWMFDGSEIVPIAVR